MLGPRAQSEKIEAVVDQYGGWNKILSPEYEPTADLLTALEAVGMSKKEFTAKRNWHTMSPRERQIKKLALALWREWSLYLNAERGRDREAPHISGRPVTEVPTEFWQAYAQWLEQHRITVKDIENEIVNHPDAYPPLVPTLTRAQKVRDERRTQLTNILSESND